MIAVILAALPLVAVTEAHAAPVSVQTTDQGHVAGEAVVIVAHGFTPGESVDLRVTHPEGTAEPGMGHDVWTVIAGPDGAFTTTWAIHASDAQGDEFLVTASGFSGATSSATFDRMAVVETDKFQYAQSESASIVGSGFIAGEGVALQVFQASGAAGEPWTVTADSAGRITSALSMGQSGPAGAESILRAQGQDSGLGAAWAFSDLSCPPAPAPDAVVPYALPDATCPDNLNSCTANDVVTTVVAADPGQNVCGRRSDSLPLTFTVRFETTANQRYDLGVYISEDGGTVTNGSGNTPPTALVCAGAAPQIGWGDGNADAADCDSDHFLDLDPTGHSPNPNAIDTCGDLENNAGPVYWTVSATISCQTVDENLHLKVPSCRVWEQNANHQGVCTTLAQAGTGSKCDCTDLDFTTVLDPCVTALCDDENVCTLDSCTVEGGVAVCHHDPVSDGTSCDNETVCDGHEQCVGGTCAPGTPLNCDDGNVCTDDSCDQATGCVHTDNDDACDDENACTKDSSCADGECGSGTPVVCGDNNPCTDDSCDPEVGCVFDPNTESCDDLNACTSPDLCAGGECVGGGPVVCDDGNPCTDDSCDSATGCVFVNNTTPCDDGNACTTGDTCGGGSCAGGPPPNCDDDNVCTVDGCDPATGCTHDGPAANGTECDDGNACTGGAGSEDHCVDGECQGGGTVNCDDSNPCTDDSCDPATGCVHENNTDPCDDGSACTTSDTCGGGTCHGGAPPNCDDGNGCTDDSCDPATGCVHQNNTDSCDDGSACTTNDTCGGGTCHGGAPPNCDDGNGCTDDACDAVFGCVHENNAVACDDGNACTKNDTCGGGSCQAGTPITCDDANPCTDDSCDPATGCVYKTNELCEVSPKTQGFWRRLCAGPHPEGSITQADVDCVNDSCTFGSITTLAELCDRLTPNPSNDKCEQGESQLMALMLNYCQGRLTDAAPIDSACTNHTTAGPSRVEADTLLCSSGRTQSTCTVAQCEAEELNSGSALFTNSLRIGRVGDGSLRLTWDPPYGVSDLGPPHAYVVRRRPNGEAAFQQLYSGTELSYVDTTAATGTFYEYEVTPVW